MSRLTGIRTIGQLANFNLYGKLYTTSAGSLTCSAKLVSSNLRYKCSMYHDFMIASKT
jgi:hypothetical protein